jgi:DNA-binding XRE family transcriptional regulator
MEGQMKIDGAKVRKLRDLQGWSQEQLAEAAGVGVRTIQRAEAQGSASRETKVCLASALGVPHAELEPSPANLLSVDTPRSELPDAASYRGAIVPVPRVVRVVCTVMAVFSLVVLMPVILSGLLRPSLIHLVFLVPLALTVWTAYIAIRGGVPRAFVFGSWAR